MSWLKKAVKGVSDFAVKGLKTSARVVTTGGSAVGGFLVGGPAGATAAAGVVNSLWSAKKTTNQAISEQALASVAEANNMAAIQSFETSQSPRFDLGDYIKLPEIKTQVTANADDNTLVKFGFLGAILIAIAMYFKKSNR